MTNNIKIRIEELSAYDRVPYNIYSEAGAVLSKKGDLLDSKLLSRLSIQTIYRAENPDGPFSKGAGFGINSKISRETSEFVINITKEFIEAAEKGNKPSIQGFYQARDKILEEVLTIIDQIQYASELKVFDEEYNYSHAVNVSTLSTAIGIKLNVDKDTLKDITLGGLLHDIGKTRIPKQILNKPDKLTLKEYEVMKLHSALGYKIIKDEYALSPTIAMVAMDHQERYDGSGYARRIEGERIHRLARIISVADVYDATTSDKVYASAKSPKEVLKELLKLSKQFEPSILYTLIHMINPNTGTLKQKLTVS